MLTWFGCWTTTINSPGGFSLNLLKTNERDRCSTSLPPLHRRRNQHPRALRRNPAVNAVADIDFYLMTRETMFVDPFSLLKKKKPPKMYSKNTQQNVLFAAFLIFQTISFS